MATEVAEREETRRKRTSPLKFLQEVRAEGRKVTWATWKETWVSTVIVMILVVVAATFFFLADQLLSLLVRFILGIGG
ncbi:MAG: preprotein translocase subunit SecE [Hyphomonadaceae bacterium]|nr:preprotein translocase subunit SecE [Hyphomonadaceae bacterium]